MLVKRETVFSLTSYVTLDHCETQIETQFEKKSRQEKRISGGRKHAWSLC